MKLTDTYLSSIGTWVPPVMLASDAQASGLYDPGDYADSELVSVLVAGSDSPADMAVRAAGVALERSGAAGTEIDYLLHAFVFFQGPEMWSTPGYILRELGLEKTRAAEIRNGCNGLLTAMELAATMISATESGNNSVLLTTADNFNSPVIDRWAASPLGTIAADAASAAIITRQVGFARLESIVSRHFPELEALQRGDEPLFPPTGSSGRSIDIVERANCFTQTLPDPASISDALAAALSEVADTALTDAGLTTADMRWVICNNTSKWTLERLFLEPLGVSLAKSTWDYGCTVGHAGASDHILSLEHLLRRGELDRGDRVLLVGGAPGWMAASAVLTIEEVPSW